MLYWLSEYLQEYLRSFAVFQYLTVRAILGVLTALGISLLLGPWFIRRLTELRIGQSVRNDGPQSHLSKSGTPTMGGALILSAIFISTLLWADLSNRYVWVVLIVTAIFGAATPICLRVRTVASMTRATLSFVMASTAFRTL